MLYTWPLLPWLQRCHTARKTSRTWTVFIWRSLVDSICWGGWKHWWDIAKTGIRYIDNEPYYYTTGKLNGLHETERFENEQNALGTERNFFWLYAWWILACWYWLCVALVRVFKFNNCIILNVVQNRWFNVSETLNLYSMKWIFFNVKKKI